MPEKMGCRCCWRNQKGPGLRWACGVCCIILSMIILLLCAPEWMIALLVAALLFVLGTWILWGRRRR